jgi:uncharacterized protein
MSTRFTDEFLYILKASNTSDIPNMPRYGLFKRAHFMLLLTPHLRRLAGWRNQYQHPLIATQTKDNSILYHSLYRTYISKNWNVAKKMDVIETHYHATNTFANFLHIQENQYIDLFESEATYSHFRIVVDSPSWMRVEGEVTVSLFYRDIRLHWLTFSIALVNAEYVLIVGALQGWAGMHGDERASIKQYNVELSKKLHQLHPRILLFYCIKMIARYINVSEIWGVSQENHRTKVWHNLTYRKQVKGYSNFWLEHGGVLNKEGFYVISAKKSYKPIEQVPSNKRQQYKKRYQLIDEVETQLINNIREKNYQISYHQ